MMGKRGPAPRGEYADKSAVLSTRIRADTRAALERASKKSGRSLSQEIERRLRRSLEEPERIADRFGSEQIYRIMLTIANAMTNAAKNASRLKGLKGDLDWLYDPWAFNQACHSIARVLAALAPAGTAAAPAQQQDGLARSVETVFLNSVGAANANAVLDAIRNADANGDEMQQLGARIKDGLGEELTQRIVRDFDRRVPPVTEEERATWSREIKK